MYSYYLKALGISVWVRRTMPNRPTIIETPQTTKALSTPETEWENLAKEITGCQKCALYKTRTHPVVGVGDHQADLVIIGEAPGAQEDKKGEPFVGRAGQLLTAMLHSIGLNRDQVYITNILKSRPPNNRDPQPAEVSACTPFLSRQLFLIRPKLILALGRIAAHYLLATKEAMSILRGQLFKYGPDKTPLIVSYHPAYLLRSPLDKRKACQDFQFLSKLLSEVGY